MGNIWINNASGSGVGAINLGNGSNGVIDSAGNITLQGAGYEYKPMILQYESFKLNYGHTMTIDKPIASLVILCKNAIEIDGIMDFTGCGQYIDIDPKLIVTSMPIMYKTIKYPTPINGEGGDGGKGGQGAYGTGYKGGIGGTGGKWYGYDAISTPGAGGAGAPPQGGGGGGNRNYSALGGGGGGGGMTPGYPDANMGYGGGGGSNWANGSGRTGGLPYTPSIKKAGLNIVICALKIIINGRLLSDGTFGGNGAAGSGLGGGGGGGGGNGGGGINIYYRMNIEGAESISNIGGKGGTVGTGFYADAENGKNGKNGDLMVTQI